MRRIAPVRQLAISTRLANGRQLGRLEQLVGHEVAGEDGAPGAVREGKLPWAGVAHDDRHIPRLVPARDGGEHRVALNLLAHGKPGACSPVLERPESGPRTEHRSAERLHDVNCGGIGVMGALHGCHGRDGEASRRMLASQSAGARKLNTACRPHRWRESPRRAVASGRAAPGGRSRRQARRSRESGQAGAEAGSDHRSALPAWQPLYAGLTRPQPTLQHTKQRHVSPPIEDDVHPPSLEGLDRSPRTSQTPLRDKREPAANVPFVDGLETSPHGPASGGRPGDDR